MITHGAKGSFDNFVKTGKPTLIPTEEYQSWLKESLSKQNYNAVIKKYGDAPGSLMNVEENGKSYLAIAKIQFGNVALLPQPLAAFWRR